MGAGCGGDRVTKRPASHALLAAAASAFLHAMRLSDADAAQRMTQLKRSVAALPCQRRGG
jgi:hypothetical protein